MMINYPLVQSSVQLQCLSKSKMINILVDYGSKSLCCHLSRCEKKSDGTIIFVSVPLKIIPETNSHDTFNIAMTLHNLCENMPFFYGSSFCENMPI
jgi:hypothetical protein